LPHAGELGIPQYFLSAGAAGHPELSTGIQNYDQFAHVRLARRPLGAGICGALLDSVIQEWDEALD